MPVPISVLYISYTGLLDPLGQSQVLQYVLGLARQHRMTLLTFERPDALCQHNQLAAVREQCITAGVDWHYLTYHNRPNLPATAYDTAMGVRQGIKLARAANARIVHCRSYIAGLMGLAVSRATGAKHIFDMRGFWPDERVDGGIWHRASAKYRIFKRLERSLFLNTDHVVSLTQAAAKEIVKFPYLGSRCPPISVIPTCTNLGLFRPPDTTSTQSRARGFTLGYVGSTGSWYLFDEVALAVSALFERHLDAQFVVVNQADHDSIRHRLLHAGVDLSRVTIVAAEFSSVPKQIARMDAGIFFIKPAWSKRASCPTRLGEFLAMGKPCLANSGVGDVDAILTTGHTGVLVDQFDIERLRPAVDNLIELSQQPGTAKRCRAQAQDYFSLEKGVQRYAAIYTSLANNTGATPL